MWFDLLYLLCCLVIALELQNHFLRQHLELGKKYIAIAAVSGILSFSLSLVMAILLCSAVTLRPFAFENLRLYQYRAGFFFFFVASLTFKALQSLFFHKRHRIFAFLYRRSPMMLKAEQKKDKRLPFTDKLIFLFCLITLLETFGFNYRHYLPSLMGLSRIEYTAEQFENQTQLNYLGSEGCVVVAGNASSFQLQGINTHVVSVQINARDFPSYFSYQLGISDEAYAYGERRSTDFLTHTDVERSSNIALCSNGELSSLTFYMNSNARGLHIRSVEINAPAPFQFSILRFGGLFLLLAGLLSVTRYRLWRVLYLPTKPLHRAVMAVSLFLVLTFSFFTYYTSLDASALANGTAIDLAYTEENIGSDAYRQMFDAFLKGRLNLEMGDFSELSELKNPYDPSERVENEVAYPWDRAYYNGYTYSYFGVAPLFTVYYPYYFLTGRIPTTGTVTFLLSVLFFTGVFFLYRLVVERFCSKVPLLLYWMGYFAVSLCANLLWVVRRPDYYEVAAASGQAFLVWFLFFALSAFWRLRFQKLRMLLAGCFLVGLAASRPNLLLYVLLTVPCFLAYFVQKQQRWPQKAKTLACFAVPAFLGACALMWYNAARFGSVFEFGSTYQLTVSDIRYNSVTKLSNLLPAFYHYLFQPPMLDMAFPFIMVSGYPMALNHNYYFLSYMVGAYVMPVTLFGAACLPGFRKYKARAERWFLLLLFLLPFIMIYVDFSVGGALFRYSLDFLCLLALSGTLGVFLLYHRYYGRGGNKPLFWMLFLLLSVSVLVAVLLSFSGENNLFLNRSPQQFLSLKYLLEWWR